MSSHKKDTPLPLARALDAGVAPRPLSPLRKLAIPAGLAVGLTLTGVGLAIELRANPEQGAACSNRSLRPIGQNAADNAITPPVVPSIRPDQERPSLGGAPPGPEPETEPEPPKPPPTAAPTQSIKPVRAVPHMAGMKPAPRYTD